MKCENLYTPNFIRTVSGIYVNVFDPKPEMFEIEDIAHALSSMPRFAGHLRHFYSVAQHCLAVSEKVCKENRLAALLHDASEAYLMDLPRPIKHNISQYKEIENGLMVCISEKFGFEWPLNNEVKEADEMELKWEWETLMLKEQNFYGSPGLVKDAFLLEFKGISC